MRLVRDATTLLFDEPLTGLDPVASSGTNVGARAPARGRPLSSHLAPRRGGLHARHRHGPRPEDCHNTVAELACGGHLAEADRLERSSA